MATHNGARFLGQQIDSIRAQTFENWTLLISDDCSTDETLKTIKEASARDSRIFLLPTDRRTRLGPVRNFGTLFNEAYKNGAAICFISDQDDFWYPRKMEEQLNNFRNSGWETEPIAAFCNMELINEYGGLIHPSFYDFRRLVPEPNDPLNQLLSFNYVPGCSICVNRRLLEIATPLPDQVIMHDWWLMLVAAAFGKLSYSEDALFGYRQHSNNLISAAGEGMLIRNVGDWKGTWKRGGEELSRTFVQAEKLRERLNEYGGYADTVAKTIEKYTEIPELGLFSRLYRAHELNLRQNKPLLKLVLLLRLTLGSL
jgi:rhamnosyltransferase